jgi:Clp amino terminal domain, pathogenicity island component
VFERFTDKARRVVVLAQEEARLLDHNYIGTEHILLGLVREGEGVAARALQQLDISLETVRSRVEAIIGRGTEPSGGHIPFTPRAKKVLELSLREALQLGHNYIGTEHILLGLVREGEGVAAQVLLELGAGLDRVRQQVIQVLSGHAGPSPAATVGMVPGGPPPAAGRAPAEPLRVVPLATEAASGEGWRLVLLSLEIWSAWVDLRYAVLGSAAGQLPPPLRWRLADDAGGAYTDAGSSSGGDQLLQVHQVRFQPAPPETATTLTLTATDQAGAEAASLEVPYSVPGDAA